MGCSVSNLRLLRNEPRAFLGMTQWNPTQREDTLRDKTLTMVYSTGDALRCVNGNSTDTTLENETVFDNLQGYNADQYCIFRGLALQKIIRCILFPVKYLAMDDVANTRDRERISFMLLHPAEDKLLASYKNLSEKV